jgi:hypothetical protein
VQEKTAAYFKSCTKQTFLHHIHNISRLLQVLKALRACVCVCVCVCELNDLVKIITVSTSVEKREVLQLLYIDRIHSIRNLMCHNTLSYVRKDFDKEKVLHLLHYAVWYFYDVF